MEYVPNFFKNPDSFTSFLLHNTNVMVNCITHTEFIKEIVLIFPSGSIVSLFSDGRKIIYNIDKNEIEVTYS
jgi:hypothetical protein